MVAQIGADARQIVDDIDALRLEVGGGADARQQQDLRRIDRAGRQHDLAPRPEPPHRPALPELDADRALALEQHARRLRARFDDEIGAPPHMRMDIGARRRPALAVFLRHLIEAETLLLRAVEILVDTELRLPRRFEKDLLIAVVRAQIGDIQRPALPVQRVFVRLVVLGLAEVGQNVVPAPAGAAHVGPAVVIGVMAAHIDHGVDARRAAEHLAARHIALAAVEALLRHGLVAPVADFCRQHGRGADGRAHQHALALAARLQQADAQGRVFGQAPRERAAGRAAAGDDDVEFPVVTDRLAGHGVLTIIS